MAKKQNDPTPAAAPEPEKMAPLPFDEPEDGTGADAHGNEVELSGGTAVAVAGAVRSGTPSVREEAAPRAVTRRVPVEEETGFEDLTKDDLSIPFLNLLQKGSPQVDEDNPAAVKGAKPGLGYNSVTGELYDLKDRGILIIPVHRTHTMDEWIPRDDGGGFRGSHPVDGEVHRKAKADLEAMSDAERAKIKSGKLPGPDGNDLVETFKVYCLVINEDGSLDRIVLSFSSTAIKNYRNMMTVATSITEEKEGGRKALAPLWSRRYRLMSEFQQNDQYTWYVLKAKLDGTKAEAKVTDEQFDAAKAFRMLITSGAATANMSSVTATVGGSGGDDGEADGF